MKRGLPRANTMNVPVYDMYLGERKIPYLAAVKETAADGRKAYGSPDEIAELICNAFHADRLAEERLWMIGLDTKLHAIAFSEITKGTHNTTMCPKREVCQRALMCGATYVALAHNHPSGDPTPSEEDIASTKAVKEGLTTIGIPLVDHVIIGGVGNYASMKEQGLV